MTTSIDTKMNKIETNMSCFYFVDSPYLVGVGKQKREDSFQLMRKAPGNVYFITLSPAVFKHSLDFCSVCGVRLKIGAS